MKKHIDKQIKIMTCAPVVPDPFTVLHAKQEPFFVADHILSVRKENCPSFTGLFDSDIELPWLVDTQYNKDVHTVSESTVIAQRLLTCILASYSKFEIDQVEYPFFDDHLNKTDHEFYSENSQQECGLVLSHTTMTLDFAVKRDEDDNRYVAVDMRLKSRKHYTSPDENYARFDITDHASISTKTLSHVYDLETAQDPKARIKSLYDWGRMAMAVEDRSHRHNVEAE